MKTQLKFVVDKNLADRFKQEVLKRRGKLDLSKEGEEALRLYLKTKGPVTGAESQEDPILKVIGIATSRGNVRPNALDDKRRLYDEA